MSHLLDIERLISILSSAGLHDRLHSAEDLAENLALCGIEPSAVSASDLEALWEILGRARRQTAQRGSPVRVSPAGESLPVTLL